MTDTTVQLDALAAGDDPAVDLISTRMYQQVKLVDGTLDSEVKISAAAGTAATALRTTLASDDPGVALLATIDSDTNTIQTDTTSIDGKITACDTGAVVVSSGAITADLGANNDVTVQGEDAENAAAAANPVLSGGRYDTSPRTLGNGDVGAFAVDVAGVMQVGGTVALSSTDNTVLDNILVDTTAIAAAVGGTHIDDAAFTAGTDDGVPIFGFWDDTSPTDIVTDGDSGIVRMTQERSLHVTQKDSASWQAHVDYASAQTNATVKAAPGASLSLYITDVIISNGATAGNITLLDGSGGTVLFEIYPAINGGVAHSFRNPLKLTANTLLAITSTTVTTHSVTVSGYIAA